MPYPKQDPEKKVRAICGGTTKRVIDLVKQEAIVRKITVCQMVGSVLEDWAGDRVATPIVDPRQYHLYRRDGEPKEGKGTTEYREGPLGKERNTGRILRKGE